MGAGPARSVTNEGTASSFLPLSTHSRALCERRGSGKQERLSAQTSFRSIEAFSPATSVQGEDDERAGDDMTDALWAERDAA